MPDYSPLFAVKKLADISERSIRDSVRTLLKLIQRADGPRPVLADWAIEYNGELLRRGLDPEFYS